MLSSYYNLLAMLIIPTGSVLGAEIRDVNFSRPLNADTAASLKRALLEHLVLFVRNQNLSETEQVRFSRHFGDPQPHVRKQPVAGLKEIFVVSNVSENDKPIGALGNGELTFHSDLSYLPKPGSVSIVHAIAVPNHGGDTQWSNAYAAYDALPNELKNRVVGLRAVHRHAEKEQNPNKPVSHPIVRTHPETGRRAMYVSPQFTRTIEGINKNEGDMLLATLLEHVTRSEFVWTHKWAVGDLVVWDNRCTMHRREPFEATEKRILKRTQMFGDVPFLDL